MQTEMLEEPAFAAIMVQLFEGTCYLTPLLGAWLADSRWGRYKTILVFSTIYVLVRTRTRSVVVGDGLLMCKADLPCCCCRLLWHRCNAHVPVY